MKGHGSAASQIQPTPAVPRREPRRFWSQAMLFLACVLLVNGLFGEHGFTETRRARRAATAAAAELARLQHDNDRLRAEVQRLRDDPATIESVARSRLGMARPGEIVVNIGDVK